jgi:hypothetical protein
MITEVGNVIALYDLTRPFVWKFKSTTATNLVYVIQKLNPLNVYVNVSGLLRQPVDFGSNGEFYINPSEILADEIDTQIRPKGESAPRIEFSGSVQFRLLLTEEVLQPNNTLQYDTNQNNWFTSQVAYGIDAATQHEETFGMNQATWFDMHRITISTGTQEGKWCTNRPYSITNAVDDNDYAYVFINVKLTKVRVTIESESSSLHTFDTGYLLYGLNTIGIGVPNIIDAIGQSTWDTISNNAHKVKYFVVSFQNQIVTEIGSYIINKKKCTPERLRVYWKNRKGGVDGYTFNSELSVSTNVTSKLYKRGLGYRRSNSENINEMGYLVNNTYGSDTRTMGSINIKAQESINVVSRFHTQTELRWLSEISTSPQVWIENLQTGNLNSVYSISKKVDTKPKGKTLGQIKYRFRMSNEIMTQR